MLRRALTVRQSSARRLSYLRLSAFICVCVFATANAAAQAPVPNERAGDLRAKTQKQLEEIVARFDGVMGLAAKDLTSGEAFTVNPDMVFPQASSIKIPVLIELYRQAQAGKLKLDEKVAVSKAVMVGGSGVLGRFSDGGSSLSLRDLAVLMIVLSDNTATNILIDRVGMAAVNDMLARASLKQTKLQRKMIDTESQRAGRENLSTPAEMIWLLGLLHTGKLLDAPHTAGVMEILKYPKNTALRRGIPANVELASKPGGLSGVSCDSGIVLLEGRPFAIAVMTTYAGPQAGADDAITEATRRVFAYFERLAKSNALGVRVQ